MNEAHFGEGSRTTSREQRGVTSLTMESVIMQWQLEWYHGITMLSSLIIEAGAFFIENGGGYT